MDREDLERILDIDSSHQATIDLMVRELIATRGYDSVIEKLIASVYNLGEISLADPGNSTKLRDFDMWAAAVRAAIVRHHHERAFDAIVTDLDHYLAAQMGIRLG